MNSDYLILDRILVLHSSLFLTRGPIEQLDVDHWVLDRWIDLEGEK